MTGCTLIGTPIPLWRLAPAANPRDPRWQGRAIHAETIVRAPTAAMARVVASRLDRRPDAVPRGNESLCFRSGFTDEKLYWVQRLEEAAAEKLQPEGASETERCEVLAAA